MDKYSEILRTFGAGLEAGNVAVVASRRVGRARGGLPVPLRDHALTQNRKQKSERRSKLCSNL